MTAEPPGQAGAEGDDREPPADPHVVTGRHRRRAKLVRTSLRAGRRTLGAKVRGAFANEDRKAELMERAMIRSAEDAAETLGNMKGIVMKMGQMASFVAQALPENVRGPLMALQQDAPPMTWELSREALTAELGAPPEEVFDDIDPEPAAAASIGQVHRALLPDGTKVAVKVQYPGVDAAIHSDLQNAGMLKMFMSRMMPGVDLDSFVDEFRARVTDELDYRVEADNQEEFAAAWAGDDTVVVPRVFREFSSRRVLVTEWFDGDRFEAKWDAPPDERERIGITLYRYAQRCIGELRMFNGDPHPGNYVFLPDGRIVFLDFGCIKRLDKAALENQLHVQRAVRSGSPAQLKGALVAAGQVDPADAIPPEQLWRFMEAFFEPILSDAPYRFTPEGRFALMERLVSTDGEFFETRQRVKLPPEMLFFMRLNAGLGAILSRLEVEANWYRIHEQYWPDPTANTPT